MEDRREYYTLDDLCRLHGLEKSRVRFIEREFGRYFGFPDLAPLPSLYTSKQAAVLKKIDALLDRPDLTVERIKAAFRRLAMERGKGTWVLAVTSGKGGVGKTSLAVNLGVMLAARGLRTVLLDADLGLANAQLFLGVRSRYSLADLLRGRAGLEEVLVRGPGGVGLIPGGSGLSELADLSDSQVQRLLDLVAGVRRAADVLVVDTSPGVSRSVLRFLEAAHQVLVVATPNLASMLDAYGLLRAAAEQGVAGPLDVVVNRVRTAAQAEEVHARIGRAAASLPAPAPRLLGYVFEDSAVEEAIQAQTPVARLRPEAPAVLCLEDLVRRLAARREEWRGRDPRGLYDIFVPNHAAAARSRPRPPAS